MATRVRELMQTVPLQAGANRIRREALDYACHGWGVIAGSVWDGTRYTQGHTTDDANGLRPVLPRGRTLREARRVWSWWSVAPYSIIARAGEDFDAIAVPVWLGVRAVSRPEFEMEPCPVINAPDTVRFLVRPGAVPRRVLGTVPGVRIDADGGLIVLPPTRIAAGEVSWLVAPSGSDWQLGDGEIVQDLLSVTLAEDGHHPVAANDPR